MTGEVHPRVEGAVILPTKATGVGSIFDPGAESYDRARRQLIPCFDLFYGYARQGFDRWTAGLGATIVPSLAGIGHREAASRAIGRQ